MNIEKIKEYYVKAKENHPHFCDMITCLSETGAETHLGFARRLLDTEVETGNVEVGDVLWYRFCEAVHAYTNGDTASAVDRCYAAIAVLLRAIDVLEGRQTLGKPSQKGGAE